MFDSDLINELSPEAREDVRRGLVAIAKSGIIEKQRLRIFARIADKADTVGDDFSAADDLKVYRQQAAMFRGLQHLGESLDKERDDETDEE